MPRCEARAGARRGRPPKPVEELTQGHRAKKESNAHIAQAVAEHGEEEGKRLHREWLQRRSRERDQGGENKVQSSIRGFLTNPNPRWLHQVFGVEGKAGGGAGAVPGEGAQVRCVYYSGRV